MDICALGDVNSSDSEAEEFYVCKSDCSSITLYYCLAIKQACCTTQCNYEKNHSRTRNIDADVQSQLGEK